eukprot:Phypoly_transcript_02414.p1 GENE.Phypoly_transcript_02414~~Phypoly_transcript_02414.p1  ORF type:complete len:759 (+),score=54.12 Phypoly_transcript_02414:477-2753(+)
MRPDLLQLLNPTRDHHDLGCDNLSNVSLHVAPIPASPTNSFFFDYMIPGIGELMQASFMDGNHDSDGSDINRDISKWWVSEKYDGFRACWNPTSKKLYSRFNRELYLKCCFTALFPEHFLDGEMWFGRGAFIESQKLHMWGTSEQNNTNNNNAHCCVAWHLLRMTVLDLPDIKLHCSPIEDRLKGLLCHVPNQHPFLVPIANIVNRGQKAGTQTVQIIQPYQWLLAHVLNDQGEGIVLRAPSSIYLPGRSNLWLKLKVLRDQEALVLSIPQIDVTTACCNYYVLLLYVLSLHAFSSFSSPYSPFCMITLLFRPCGLTCTAVLLNDNNDHVQCGDVVTFSYSTFEKTSIPSHCRILRKRYDVSWDDVLFLHDRNLRAKKVVPEKLLAVQASTRKPPGFWSNIDQTDDPAKPNNLRLFFDKFASSKNFDGTSPENWFLFTKQDILQEKGGASLLRHYSSSLRLALATAYPVQLGLVADLVSFCLGFRKLPSKFWDKADNRKQFLSDIALRRQLNPTILDTWAKITEQDIKKERGGISFIQYCTNHHKGLLSVVDESFFSCSLGTGEKGEGAEVSVEDDSLQSSLVPRGTRTTQRNQITRKALARKYFKTVAAMLGINSQVDSHWYGNFPLVHDTVISDKHGIEIISWYSGSVSKALSTLFPELNLVQTKLISSLRAHEKQGSDLLNLRLFFEQVSRKLCFDPLIPENWYPISIDTILGTKVGNKRAQSISWLLGGINIPSQLLKVFPEVSFESDRFIYIK